MMRFRTALLFSLLAMLASTSSASAAQPSTFRTGLLDEGLTTESPTREAWMSKARDARASLVLVNVRWLTVAGTPPAQPTNPADPAYDWTSTDSAVRSILAHGMTPILRLFQAPIWAEGKNAAPGHTTGSWRPDVGAFGAFAEAVAQRYSGRFADPLFPGRSLPRIVYFQPWNEPNVSTYLSPQWVRSGDQFVPEAPDRYRALLNTAYAAIKRVDGSNVVIGGSTAPFGDPPGGLRRAPEPFIRELLSAPTQFDILGHDPYAVGPPESHALGDGAVSTADLDKLTRILRPAEAAGNALPKKRHPLWAMEFAYDGSPPDPDGVPERKRARWLAEVMYVFWRQGAEAMVWQQIRDQLPDPDFASTFQGGLYFYDGRPKLSLQAFQFPFVTERLKAKRYRSRVLRAWARPPIPGKVRIQIRKHRRWRTLATVRVRGTNAVVVRNLRLRHAATLRATVGSFVSVPWVQDE